MLPSVGINGFGRIGRLVLRAGLALGTIRCAAINDPFMTPEMMAYLLRYDSVHGAFPLALDYDEHALIIDGARIPCYECKDPAEIPWAQAGADYVVESTGVFLTREKAEAHLRGGARHVIMSAPPKDDTPMFVMGVNHTEYAGQAIVSCASCTTNCLAPLAKVVHDRFGIQRGLMTTIHAATATQPTVDGASKKDPRGGRAAFCNLIPSTTGAARAVGKVLPALNGKLTGIAVRVPVPDVSLVDLTVELETPASYADVCAELRRASEQELFGLLAYTDEPVVSSDFTGNTHSCIFDADAGLAIDDTFLKLVAWYDNEYGYSCNVTRLIAHMNAHA